MIIHIPLSNTNYFYAYYNYDLKLFDIILNYLIFYVKLISATNF